MMAISASPPHRNIAWMPSAEISAPASDERDHEGRRRARLLEREQAAVQRLRHGVGEQQAVVDEREAVAEAAEHEHGEQQPEVGRDRAQQQVDGHARRARPCTRCATASSCLKRAPKSSRGPCRRRRRSSARRGRSRRCRAPRARAHLADVGHADAISTAAVEQASSRRTPGIADDLTRARAHGREQRAARPRRGLLHRAASASSPADRRTCRVDGQQDVRVGPRAAARRRAPGRACRRGRRARRTGPSPPGGGRPAPGASARQRRRVEQRGPDAGHQRAADHQPQRRHAARARRTRPIRSTSAATAHARQPHPVDERAEQRAEQDRRQQSRQQHRGHRPRRVVVS